MAKYGFGESSPIEDVFDEAYESTDSSYVSVEERARINSQINGRNAIKLSTDISETPVLQVRSSIFEAEKNIKGLIVEIEKNMTQAIIDPYSTMELEKAHAAVWKDAVKHSSQAKQIEQPGFIPYEEYQFAETHLCRSCRAFVKEYELAVSHSTFGHLLEAKKALSYLLSELTILKNIAIYYIGETYRDESEAQIAKYINDWARSAAHYTQQIAKEVTTPPISIPQPELGEITEKQAAQFQAFFSIRVNSYTTEIQTLLGLMKRDSVDAAHVFYNNYLMPALTFKSKVVEPMMLEMGTSPAKGKMPTLMREVFTATSAVTGNLGAITADMLERNNLVYRRFDAFLQAMKLKRRYVNYIRQLEEIGIKRNSLLLNEPEENFETYREIFKEIFVDTSARENLRSSHNDLDDLDGDAHPQYLRKDGGTITGDIFLEPGVRIAGVDIVGHTHSGEDGSSFVSASSIDYVSAREDYYDLNAQKPYGDLTLTELNSFILTGGVPQYEAVFEIEVDDDKLDTYEFEILYKEI
jgi:hypothetical protein